VSELAVLAGEAGLEVAGAMRGRIFVFPFPAFIFNDETASRLMHRGELLRLINQAEGMRWIATYLSVVVMRSCQSCATYKPSKHSSVMHLAPTNISRRPSLSYNTDRL
jgi:hypothetical protein